MRVIVCKYKYKNGLVYAGTDYEMQILLPKSWIGTWARTRLVTILQQLPLGPKYWQNIHILID